MRSPLEFRRRGGGSFDIASTNPSAYYDRTNLATLFQDRAGTTPVTAGSQPIGLGLDQSQGLVLGAELAGNPGGPFINTSEWYDTQGNAPLTVDGGMLAATPTTTAPSRTETLFPTVTGEWYLFQCNVDQFSGAGETLAILTSSNGGIVPGTVVIGTTGTCKQMFKATTASTYVTIGSNISTIGVPNKIVSLSVKLLAGNHQLQSTAGKRPITDGSPIYANFDAVDDDLVAVFPASLGAGCTVCRSLPGTGASITTGVTLTATYTDNVDAHALLIYTAAQWASLDAGQIANITTWLNGRAGL